MRVTLQLLCGVTMLVICNPVDGMASENDRVVLVAPVLASTSISGVTNTETAKDFPVLTLLAGDNKQKSMKRTAKNNPRPVYVRKLEDQKREGRRRRFSKMVIIRRI